jgi:hypothetical protein
MWYMHSCISSSVWLHVVWFRGFAHFANCLNSSIVGFVLLGSQVCTSSKVSRFISFSFTLVCEFLDSHFVEVF